MSSGKQPAGLKLTSGSGGQTFYEVPLLANRSKKNLYLIDTMGNYIMGISKPIDPIVKVRMGWPPGGSLLLLSFPSYT